MNRIARAGALALSVVAALGSVLQPAASRAPSGSRETAYRANNVGIAFLEQFDYDRAAASFRQALGLDAGLDIARFNLALALFYANDADSAVREARAAADRMPERPQVHYLLGLLARAQNRSDDAITEFRAVLQRDAQDVGAKVNLGQVYVQERNYDAAVAALREAIASEPFNVTAAYNLATALARSGAQQDSQAAMERFQTLRDSSYGTTYSQTYLAQGKYAEALASTGAEPELVSAAVPAVSFVDATSRALPGQGQARAVAADAGAAAGLAGGVTLVDLDDDGDLDLVDVAAAGVRVYRNAGGVLTEAPGAIGNQADAAGVPIAAVAADFDNDGRPDLFLLRGGGNRLLRQRPDRRFENVTAASGLAASSSLAKSAALVDVDHDGDLDLFIAGFRSGVAPDAPPAANQLWRNNGDGTFADITAAAKVAGGAGPGIAIVATDFDNRRDMDLVVVSRAQPPTLFQNMRDGSFRDAAAGTGLPDAAAYSSAAAADVNKDGYTDFFFGRADGPGILSMSDGSGRFQSAPAPDGSSGAVASQFVDYDNDGLLDLLVLSEQAPHLFRNVAGQWSEIAMDRLAPVGSPFQAMAVGDLNGDGDEDVVARLANGGLRVWRNEGGSVNHSLQVRLSGRVSNRGGVGSKIDLRAGSLRQRLESSATTPAVAPADFRFGLGARAAADSVRVLWPSGTLQTEVDLAAAARAGRAASRAATVRVTELDRKPSSCPYLYTWNGNRFEFVTDFMGGGELGYWAGPGQWHQPDPDEYVRIRADQLQPRGGRYELRVTNELEETMFVDRLQLIAIDHPAGVEAYPNEGLKEGGSGLSLTTTRDARPVAAAVEDDGWDVRQRLMAVDRTYPDGFKLAAIRGYAEPHTLTLDLGVDADRSVLLMTGWTDYAFSGDNVAASHSGRTLSPPSLQVQDQTGAWRTAIEDIGIPVGRPQTVVVNLRGKVPRGTREVRIVTNMRIYWDQVLVDSSGGGFPTSLTRLDPSVADLRWRGFSAASTPDGREPLRYDYSRASNVSPWKQMTGRYTREGDVRALLGKVDDLFVVSRPGDEISLSFDASRLPALAPGMARTFLLYVDGYSKEMDINSASPDSVEPLPFHAMSAYPYPPTEHYPRTDAHRDYLAEYNTRVVRRGY